MFIKNKQVKTKFRSHVSVILSLKQVCTQFVSWFDDLKPLEQVGRTQKKGQISFPTKITREADRKREFPVHWEDMSVKKTTSKHHVH